MTPYQYDCVVDAQGVEWTVRWVAGGDVSLKRVGVYQQYILLVRLEELDWWCAGGWALQPLPSCGLHR